MYKIKKKILNIFQSLNFILLLALPVLAVIVPVIQQEEPLNEEQDMSLDPFEEPRNVLEPTDDIADITQEFDQSNFLFSIILSN